MRQVFSTKGIGGSYRSNDERAYLGGDELTKGSAVPDAMSSLVNGLKADIAEIERTGEI